MISKENDIELIEKYMEGNLEVKAKADVENRLLDDVEFKELYDDLKILLAGIQQHSSKEILKQLRDFSSTLPPVSTPLDPPKLNARYLKIAATVCFLLVSSVLYFYFNSDKSDPSNELFASHFKYYPNQITRSSRSESSELTKKEKAYQAYEFQEFEIAIELLKGIPDEYDGGASLFYIGLSYLSNKDTQNAIPYFKKYLENHTVFENQTKWYLGLSYVQIHSNDEALSILETIPKNSSYYNKALIVIQELKND